MMQKRWGQWAAAVTFMACAGVTWGQTVAPCPTAANCAQVTIGSLSSCMGSVPVTFRQGPSNAQAGGIDEIAAIAFTLSLPAGTSLNGCSLSADGLPSAIHPNAAISNFRVVVENASCAGGRTHCLCRDDGGPKDSFINFVVYGPNPLPTPGPNPVDIPILPAGPQELFTIDLAATMTGSLHVYRESADSSKPQFTAYLSVGDRLAVDQTCAPVSGQPPCSAANAVSQVDIVDGEVTSCQPGIACVGDCSGDPAPGEVTVDELLKMVNVALETFPVSICLAGDENGDGSITIDEILKAVNNALNGCPTT